jgi:hypothetical protein
MKIWNFKVFVSDRGTREIDDWLDGLPPKAKAKIKKRITYLEIWDIDKWKRPYISKLKGSDKIWEIRVEFNNIQYRPLGCLGPKSNEFTLLIGAREKGDRLEPIDAIRIAEERCSLILEHERYTDEYY